MVQWKLVEAAFLKPPAGASDSEKLKAHYEYEYGFLKELVDQGKARIANLKVFSPCEVKGDGAELRLFQIWQVTIGQKLEAAQFWITTPHPRGIIVLSIIAPLQESAAAKAVMDSYMTNFGRVSAATCRRLQDAASKDR